MSYLSLRDSYLLKWWKGVSMAISETISEAISRFKQELVLLTGDTDPVWMISLSTSAAEALKKELAAQCLYVKAANFDLAQSMDICDIKVELK